jgi:23S rRNA (pseudouridine1915-N3)-methyltransferase
MYAQRYRPFSKLEITELPEGHKGSAKPNLTKTLQTESDTLLKNLDSDTFVIALDQSGQELSSEELSDLISSNNSRFVVRSSKFAFIIGGSWGLDKKVLERANLILSLGKMTLPHSLARIILVEQLYRAQMINHGRNYHK